MAIGIAENFFVDAIATVEAAVGELIVRDARLVSNVLVGAMALFFGEVAVTVSNDESEIAGAGLIDARKIDLVENAVT